MSPSIPIRFFVLPAVTAIVALGLAPATPSSGDTPAFHTAIVVPQSAKGSEPSVAVDEHGTRYVSWQSPGDLARSTDGTQFVGLTRPDAKAAGDVTTQVDAWGTVFHGEFCTTGTASTLHDCVYHSTDKGQTWTKSDLADKHPGAADRPWIDVWPHHLAPWPNGAPAETAPADSSGTIVYLEYHTFSPDDFTYVTVSKDGGNTFSTPHLLTSGTDTAGGSLCNTVPGGIATDDASGTVYALWLSPEDMTVSTNGCNYSQIGPFSKAWLSVSHDHGDTWTSHLAWHGAFDPATRTGDNASKIFASLAVDRDGQVHVMLPLRHNDNPTQFTSSCATTCTENDEPTPLAIVTSPDQGEHWTPAFEFNPSGGSNFFPWPAGGSGGTVDVAYYRTNSLHPNDKTNDWYVGFTQITGAKAVVDGDQAHYATMPKTESILLSGSPVHHGGICTFGTFCAAVPNSDRHLADALSLALDPAGGANAVWTTDNGGNKIQFACQTSGRSAFNDMPALTGCYQYGVKRPVISKTVKPKPAIVKGVKKVKTLPTTGVADHPGGIVAVALAAAIATWLIRRKTEPSAG